MRSLVRLLASLGLAYLAVSAGVSAASDDRGRHAWTGRGEHRERAEAHGDEVVVFGPRTWQRNKAAPEVMRERITVPEGVSGPWFIRLQNGVQDGRDVRDAVSAGSVAIDGIQVFGPNDFNRDENFVEKRIDVAPNSTIEVRLAGKPGGRIAITILGHKPRTIPVDIDPHRLRLSTGAIGSLSVRLAPTPTTPGTLRVTSDAPNVASVPATVAFAAGQRDVPFDVQARDHGGSRITAQLNGRSVEGRVRVVRQPVAIAALAPPTIQLARGTSGNLKLTLTTAPAHPTPIRIDSSDDAVVSVPNKVTVAAGRSSIEIPVSARAPGVSQISARLGDSVAVSRVQVVSSLPQVAALLPVTSSLTLGAQTELQLNLAAAQSTSTTVPLIVGPEGVLTAPSQVIVPAGQLGAPVPITAIGLGTAGLTASLNGSTAAAAVQVLPPAPAVSTLTPSALVLRQEATSSLRATLNATQGTATEIAVTAANPQLASVPASVTVAAGQGGVDIPVTGLAVGSTSVSAKVGDGVAQSATVTVIPVAPVPVSLLPSPLPIQQGASGQLVLGLNAAQPDDVLVSLASSAPAIAQAPAQVVVPAGMTTTPVTISGVSAGTATVTATLDGKSISAEIVVAPPPPAVAALDPAAVSLPKGVPGRLTVTLTRAPVSDVTVALLSSDPSVAEVPAALTVPAGALTAEIPVITRSEGSADISASLNGGQATSRLTVTAPELVTLAVSPIAPLAYVGESVAFLANGTYTDASVRDLTGTVTWTSGNADVASIASTGLLTAVSAGNTTVQAMSGTVVASTVVTVQDVPTLSLSPAGASLKTGDTVSFTLTTSAPAETGGLTVSLAVSGAGGLQVPATVTIPAGQTGVTFTATGLVVGDATLTATAPRRVPATIRVAVLSRLDITALTPGTGPVGSPVTITGTNFDPNPAANEVRFNGERAVVGSATATEIKVIVPVRATTGFVTITNSLGTATSPQPFTVERQHAFDISLLPETVQAPVGGFASVRVRLQSTGLVQYAHAATVSLQGLPNGVTATLERPTIYVGGETTALINIPATLAAGTYTVMVNATGQTETGSLTRTKPVNIEVLAAVTTVTGRVLHTEDDSPFAGARVRLGGQAVTTDASGYYRFVNPTVLGDQVLLIDGHTANTPTAEYPSAIAMPVMIVAGKDNLAITSYIQAVDPTKFQAIVPGTKTDVTMQELPNYALNIPQGAVLYGWDGTPVTKVNVRTVPIDRLPIKPLPEGIEARTVYLYYFFREGGANPTQPIPVTMANDIGALPEEKIDLWYYDESTSPDANSNQWRIMGKGTVTADGKSIVSDPGVGIPKFCCGATTAGNGSGGGNASSGGNGGDGSAGSGSGGSGGGGGGSGGGSGGSGGGGQDDGSGDNPPPNGNSPNNSNSGGGDPPSPNPNPNQPQSPCPVDLASGNNLAFQMRNFGIKSLMPVDLQCNYRSTDARVGPFGRGGSFAYDWFAEPAGNGAVQVTTPEGIRYLLSLQSDGAYRSTEGKLRALRWEIRPTSTGRTLKFARGREMDFDQAGRLMAIRSTSGNRIQFTRNTAGFVTKVVDGAGRSYTFDTSSITIGRVIYTVVTKITDSLGRSVSFTYDSQVRLTSHTDAGGGITRYEYDTANRISKKTDPRGGVMQFTYDAAGRTTAETLQDGTATIQYAYDTAGSVVAGTRMTDPNGNVTAYRFNGQGYVTREIDALGRVTAYNRDFARNLVQSRTDAAGRITRYTYDAKGNVTSRRDAQDNLTLYEYGPVNNKLTTVTDALGNKTNYAYDAQARLTSITDATGATRTKSWNAKGLLDTDTDPLGNALRYAYDAEGNIVAITDPLGQVSEFAYDSANRLIRSTDPLGLSSRRAWDVLDRLTEATDPEGGVTRFTYDLQDRLLTVTDPRGNLVEQNAYDARGRLTQRKDAAGLASGFKYDLAGNLTEITDRKGQITVFDYDALNRQIRRQDPDSRITRWEYDLAGNISAIRDNKSGDVLFAYDSLDRPIRIVTDQGTVDYQYDAIGRRTQRTVNGTDPVAYQYDKANRLTQMTYRGRNTVFVWDKAGRLTNKTFPNGLIQTYTWDAASRLTSTALKKPDGTVIETITYDYDASGRRTARSATVTDVHETPIEATYDNSNRLTSVTIDGQSYALTYDANGNLTRKAGTGSNNTSDVTTYTWDARNRLAAIQGQSVTASFTYDALGRRVEKTINGDSTQYLYDGQQAIAEIRGGAISATYLTGLAIDEVIARYTTQGERNLLTDALGSVILAAKEEGSVQTAYGYSPYGQTQVMGTDEGSPMQYTARENDGTGLYYYRARYYDPMLKRFVSEDPIGLFGGVNVYSYVEGKPVSGTDPDGLLVTATSGALMRGMTTGDATATGSMGNAAAAAGAAGAATTAGGMGLGALGRAITEAITGGSGPGTGVSGTILREVIKELIKGPQDDVVPPPEPPPIVRPAPKPPACK